MVAAVQPTLFGSEPVSFERVRPARVELADGAWYAYLPGWLRGDLEVFESLRDTTRWRAERRPMYDRIVDVPRMTASIPRDGPGHPVLGRIAAWLQAIYGEPFDKVGVNYYRDGRDSVAPHGDQIVRELHASTMAIVSLGARRRFVLSRIAGPESVKLDMGEGDLLVMGGTIQRTWRHGVPKTARPVGPRICVMFRPPWLG